MKTSVCLLSGVFLAAASFAAPPKSPIGFDVSRKDAHFAALRAKIDNPKTKPLDRRNAQYALLMGEMLVCEDAAFPAKEAELQKIIAERGDMPATDYVTFLYKTVRRNNYGHPRFLQYMYVEPDVDAIGFKATADDPAARRLYYSLRIAVMTDLANSKSLKPQNSRESRLELIAQAEKDPAMAGQALQVFQWRFAALRDLGRDADAVKLAESALATTNVAEAVAVNLALADFYRTRAKRFDEDPDAATLLKAEACYAKVIELKAPLGRVNTEESVARQGIADCRYARKDYAGCRVLLAEMLERKFINRPRDKAAMSARLGDCGFFEEKWQESVDAYASAGASLDAARKIRYAGALLALGRKADAIPLVEAVAQKGSTQEKKRCINALRKLKE